MSCDGSVETNQVGCDSSKTQHVQYWLMLLNWLLSESTMLGSRVALFELTEWRNCGSPLGGCNLDKKLQRVLKIQYIHLQDTTMIAWL